MDWADSIMTREIGSRWEKCTVCDRNLSRVDNTHPDLHNRIKELGGLSASVCSGKELPCCCKLCGGGKDATCSVNSRINALS